MSEARDGLQGSEQQEINISQGGNSRASGRDLYEVNIGPRERRPTVPRLVAWKAVPDRLRADSILASKLSEFSRTASENRLSLIVAPNRNVADTLLLEFVRLPRLGEVLHEARYTTDQLGDNTARELADLHSYFATIKKWPNAAIIVTYVTELPQLDQSRFVTSLAELLKTAQGRFVSELDAENKTLIFVVDPKDGNNFGRAASKAIIELDYVSAVARHCSLALSLSEREEAALLEHCRKGSFGLPNELVRNLFQLADSGQLRSELQNLSHSGRPGDQVDSTWAKYLRKLLGASESDIAFTDPNAVHAPIDLPRVRLCQCALFLLAHLGELTAEEFEALMVELLRGETAPRQRKVNEAPGAPAVALQYDEIDLVAEYRRASGQLLRALGIRTSGPNGQLDFDHPSKRAIARAELNHLNSLDVERWIRKYIVESPFFFECSEPLAEKIAASSARWLETRGGAVELFRMDKWWQSLANSVRERSSSIESNDRIETFIHTVIVNEVAKWHFARRIALLLNKIHEVRGGKTSIIPSALEQLRSARAYSILLLVLEYFTGRPDIDWLSWTREILVEGDDMARSVASAALVNRCLREGQRITADNADDSLLVAFKLWTDDQQANDGPLYSSSLLIPRVLLVAQLSEIPDGEFGKPEQLVPLIDFTRTSGLHAQAVVAVSLYSRFLGVKTIRQEGESLREWIIKRWFTDDKQKEARELVRTRLGNWGHEVHPQVFSIAVLLSELLAAICGKDAMSRGNRRSQAARALIELFEANLHKPWRRELYVACAVLRSALRRNAGPAVELRLPALHLIENVFSKYY